MYDIYKLPDIYKNIRFLSVWQHTVRFNLAVMVALYDGRVQISGGFNHFTLIIFQLFICFDPLSDIYSMNDLLMRFNEMNVKWVFFLHADKMFLYYQDLNHHNHSSFIKP